MPKEPDGKSNLSWKELASLLAIERDPAKINDLVHLLNEALKEEEEPRNEILPTPRPAKLWSGMDCSNQGLHNGCSWGRSRTSLNSVSANLLDLKAELTWLGSDLLDTLLHSVPAITEQR